MIHRNAVITHVLCVFFSSWKMIAAKSHGEKHVTKMQNNGTSLSCPGAGFAESLIDLRGEFRIKVCCSSIILFLVLSSTTPLHSRLPFTDNHKPPPFNSTNPFIIAHYLHSFLFT